MSDGLGSSVFNCVLYIVVGGGVLGATLYGAYRMKKAASAPISDDQCVACDSKDVTPLTEGAYRCNMCGYEGGSGVAALQEKAEDEAIGAMSAEERLRGGLDDLQEARSLLLACQGTLQNAANLSKVDMIGLSSDRGAAKSNELTSATTDMQKAQNLITRAAKKLNDDSIKGSYDIDYSNPLFAVDTHADNVFADFMVHGKIKEAQRNATELHDAVDAAIRDIVASQVSEG